MKELQLIGRKIKGEEGIIVGIVFGKFIEMQQQSKFNQMQKEFGYMFDQDLAESSRNINWGDEWEEDLIVYVMFRKPRKIASFEEFKTVLENKGEK